MALPGKMGGASWSVATNGRREGLVGWWSAGSTGRNGVSCADRLRSQEAGSTKTERLRPLWRSLDFGRESRKETSGYHWLPMTLKASWKWTKTLRQRLS